jgi:multisubunit Na+/H+ antiporter MnhB subunit
VSAICGLLSPGLALPAAVAFPLGLTVWALSVSDLKRMDPAGKELLDLAWFCAVVGVALGLLGVMLWEGYLLGMLPRPGTGCGCSG